MTIEETQSPLVFVECMTFNHANYIDDAMKGFVMQQTEFPFVVLVMDDASTDSEPEKIKRFLGNEFDMSSAVQDETEDYVRVVAKHKTNENCTFVVVFLKYNHYSIQKPKWKYYWSWRKNAKYIALCEGDDYWTDPLKLQKQVDFLEEHEDFSICFHNVKVYDQYKQKFVEDVVMDVKGESTICDLARGNYIHTLSGMFRANCSVSLSILGKVAVGDYLLWMLIAQYGKIYKLEDCMGVYRQGVGVWTGKEVDTVKRDLDWLIAISKLLPQIDNEDARKVLDLQIDEVEKELVKMFYVTKQASLSHAYRLGKMFLKPFKLLKT